MLTQNYLKKILHYNPLTGIFTRIYGKCSGNIIKTDDGFGYKCVTIKRKKYQLHRLAFLYMTGKIPKYVDHIDMNKSNNIWSNLRKCNSSENHYNLNKQKNNSSGYKGVFFKKHSKNKPWQAAIGLNNKNIHLGYFLTKIDAAQAYNNAAKKYFGMFAKLNIIDKKEK